MSGSSSGSGSSSKYRGIGPGGTSRQPGARWTATAVQLMCIVSAFVWFLAVVKVFLLEGVKTRAPGALSSHLPRPPSAVAGGTSVGGVSSGGGGAWSAGAGAGSVGLPGAPAPFVKAYRSQLGMDKAAKLSDKAQHVAVPSAAEWAIIRAAPGYHVYDGRATLEQREAHAAAAAKRVPDSNVAVVDPALQKKASDLAWPPVLSDGSIPPEDGIDVMPILGIKVPRFWEPPPGVDPVKTGFKINGEETIFLMIASYRDFQCRETITSAYTKSDHPERLYVGAVDQTVPGDTGCLDLEVPCDKDPSQAICKYRAQISIFHVDASMATGPVTARHIGDRMYRGQTYVMQMDAHCIFVRHWDTKIIDQWLSTQNQMAVLSSYLTDTKGSLTPQGDSTRNTRPIMCNSDYEGLMPARYLRHGSQPEMQATVKEMPMLQPFWAAGFSFSRGHFKLRVPYDAYMPMVFQGEEINVGIRGFTHGYDFYAPRDSVVFHEYAENSQRRKKIPMFWEHSEAHKGEGQKSLRRATAVIGMAPGLDPTTYNHQELDHYGIGKVRPLELFYKLFLVDPVARKATQLCPFVTSGDMHREFQKHLRPDGLGVDYAYLTDFDTQAEIDRLKHLKGPW